MTTGPNGYAGQPPRADRSRSRAAARSEPQSGASVHAGEQLTRGKYTVRSVSESGTAGLIVRLKGAASGRYVLTCAHVLGAAALAGTAVEQAQVDAVYAPHLSTCSTCEYDHPIGDVVVSTLPPDSVLGIHATYQVASVAYAVDASLVKLRPQASATNKIPKIGEPTGIRDLTAEWVLPPDTAPPTAAQSPLPAFTAAQKLTVRKYGAVTALTYGTLEALTRAPLVGPAPGATAVILQVVGVPAPGDTAPSTTYKLDLARCDKLLNANSAAEVKGLFAGSPATVAIGGSAAEPTITVTTANFSERGDSGSPVVDAAGKVIGLLQGGDYVTIYVVGEKDPVTVYTGRSQVVLIRPALDLLGVELLPPGAPAAGAAVTPGLVLERGPRAPIDWSVLDAARSRFEATPLGAQLSALGQHHFDEVRQLVHHQRRVTVAWHRFQGPGFVQAFIAALTRPGWPVPREISGVRLRDTLRVMRDVLTAHGSPGLVAAIAAHQERVLALADEVSTVQDLLDDWCPPPLRLVTARGVPGSAAAVVADEHGRYLLTAHHVAYGRGGRAGDQVHALDPDGVPVAVGVVGRGERGRGGAGESFVDAALIELSTEDCPQWLDTALAALPARIAPARPGVGAAVTKEGPATGATVGLVLDPAYHDRPEIDGQYYLAPDQLLLGPAQPDLLFCAPGDSGAAVLDADRRLCGLLWGVTGAGHGLATPIATVLERLAVGVGTGRGDAEGERREPPRVTPHGRTTERIEEVPA